MAVMTQRQRPRSMMGFGNATADIGHERDVGPKDSVLWVRSRGGDTDAFGVLFDRHARTIYNYCFRRVGDWAVAEDLLSIVFLEAWRRRNLEIPADKVLPWLLGVATNVVRNRRRAERRYAAALRRLPPQGVEPDYGDDANERLDDQRLMQRALELISQLPRRERDVFALCGWCELSYEDAALALGIPVGTVRSRLSRARARMRELDQWSGHGDERSPTAKEALEP